MPGLHTILLTTYVATTLAFDRHIRPPIRARLRARNQRGSVTTEHVLWAVAVIAIVAIVVAAVKSYVTSQANNIQ